MDRLERGAFVGRLLELAGEYGVGLSREGAELCFVHVETMLEWNERVNLTRIRKAEEIIVKHLLDSLVPARWLPREGWALDVGSGAGFPGVPLRILSPGLRMVLLEAHRRKMSFLKVVLARLGLWDIQAVQGRWESLGRVGSPGGSPEGFDLIVMRAVRLEAAHVEVLAGRHLRRNGVFAWWGGHGEGDAEGGCAGCVVEGVEYMGTREYSLPGLGRPRRLHLWVHR